MIPDLIDIPQPSPGMPERGFVLAWEQCLICNQVMTDAAAQNGWWVHMTTTGKLAPADIDLPETLDQGWHPVGKECARKVPATHRAKMV